MEKIPIINLLNRIYLEDKIPKRFIYNNSLYYRAYNSKNFESDRDTFNVIYLDELGNLIEILDYYDEKEIFEEEEGV